MGILPFTKKQTKTVLYMGIKWHKIKRNASQYCLKFLRNYETVMIKGKRSKGMQLNIWKLKRCVTLVLPINAVPATKLLD